MPMQTLSSLFLPGATLNSKTRPLQLAQTPTQINPQNRLTQQTPTRTEVNPTASLV